MAEVRRKAGATPKRPANREHRAAGSAAKKGPPSVKRPRGKATLKALAKQIAARLEREYPDAECALVHQGPYQLLVATILSAQCTDARVNMVTPALFARYPTPEAMAAAELPELERMIQSTGFFRNKAKNLKGCCERIVRCFGGKVPGRMEDLLLLPGVARKTANVVLGNAFGVPGLTIDTHMGRLARRMGLSSHSDPVKVERDLAELLPPEEWTMFSHRMIHHGRRVCAARKPLCNSCVVADICPKIGVGK